MTQNPMKNQAFRTNNPQGGNVFFIILLGIALFAALSYAVSQSMRGGSAQITLEKADMAATEIITFLSALNDKFDELVIQGCDPLAISFASTVYLRYNGTDLNLAPGGSPANCRMFYPNAQGIKPMTFVEHSNPAYSGSGFAPRPGVFVFRYYDVTNGGTSAHDLGVDIVGIDTQICLAILNSLAGSGSNFTTVPTSTYQPGSNNTYTMGTPGTLNPLVLPTSSLIWALDASANPNYCTVGMVLKMN